MISPTGGDYTIVEKLILRKINNKEDIRQIIKDINVLGYRKPDNRLYTYADLRKIYMDSLDPEEAKLLKECLEKAIEEVEAEIRRNKNYIESL